MAGDWIPIRIDLHEDPAVMSMANDLGVQEETVVGHLVRIWGWVSRQCNGDTVTNVTLDALGRVTNSRGYPELMVQYGWLTTGLTDIGKPFIRIEKFDRWLSQTAKVRATTRLRVKRHREDVTEMYGKCNGESVTNVTKMYGNCNANVTPTEQKSTEENRRGEEKERTPLSPPKGADVDASLRKSRKRKGPRNHERTYSPEFEAVWQAWRPYDATKGDKARAADLFDELSPENKQLFARAAQAYCEQRAKIRCKTEHMSTFLNGDWRQVLVDTPPEPAITPKQQSELAAIEKRQRDELFRNWESSCVRATGEGKPQPAKPDELCRPPVHYEGKGSYTLPKLKSPWESG